MEYTKPSAVILTKNRNHHWFFIHELSKVLDIKCIIIENQPNQSLFKKIQKHGFRWTILKAISKISLNTTKKIDKKFLKFQNTFDPEKTKAKFQELVLSTSNINSKKVKEKLKSISPRYLCSLGGGIIDSEGISYADLALNFHGGLSPFFNGADVMEKVFESRNLNLVGGTLMLMTEKIDAGPILGHFLPEINEDDNLESLYVKNIIGGVKLYVDFILTNESSTIDLKNLKRQKKPLHYYLGYDHSIFTDTVIKYFNDNSLIKNFLREEKIFKYYKKELDFNELLQGLNIIK